MEKEIVKDTMTIGDLIDHLKTYPRSWKVYVAIDEECNGYSTISSMNMPEYVLDKVLVISHWLEGLTDEGIIPNTMEYIEKNYTTNRPDLEKYRRGTKLQKFRSGK